MLEHTRTPATQQTHRLLLFAEDEVNLVFGRCTAVQPAAADLAQRSSQLLHSIISRAAQLPAPVLSEPAHKFLLQYVLLQRQGLVPVPHTALLKVLVKVAGASAQLCGRQQVRGLAGWQERMWHVCVGRGGGSVCTGSKLGRNASRPEHISLLNNSNACRRPAMHHQPMTPGGPSLLSLRRSWSSRTLCWQCC